MAFAVAAACGGPPRVRAPGDYLQAIQIEGNRAIETAALVPALALHDAIREGAAIDPAVLEKDTERIRTAYWMRGFFAVKVTPRVERDGHAQIVVFTVAEGRRATTRVEIIGLPPELSLAGARALVPLRDGAVFDYAAYDAAKQPLAAWLEDAGYAHVEVHSQVDAHADAALAVARYTIDPGVRCTFGEIRFTSRARPALEAAVRARLQFARGDRYSVRALEASQAAIYELGRFSTVQLVPERGGAAVIDVAVELSEANRHELVLGGGFGFEPETMEARVRTGYSVVPASQPLMTAAVDARVAGTIPRNRETTELQPKVRGLVSLKRLDLLWPRLRGEAELGADYQTIEAYTWTGQHVRLGLGAPLGTRSLQLRVGWRLERLQFDPDASIDASSAQQLGLDATEYLGEYQASLVADLRDNPIEPHRGAYLDLRAAAGTPIAGGALAYLRLAPELRGYVSLAGFVLGARARVGAVLGDVPAIERFYSGGASGHRGFSERRLSPIVSDCASGQSSLPIGGAGLVETGVELRRQIATLWTWPIGANLFVDGGDVRCKPEALDPRKLYWAIGGGVWVKLVGDFKLRVDAGYLLPGTGADSLADEELGTVDFHFGVGEAF